MLVEAGHEQPTARAEQPREFGTERVVVTGQVGGGERDAGVRWPRTDGLGMTDRTKEILNTVLDGKSALEPSVGTDPLSR